MMTFLVVCFDDSNLMEELNPPTNMYDGSRSCLHHVIARQFKTAMECLIVVGGYCACLKLVTANSNEYNMTNSGEFAFTCWRNITVEEMIWFHGCILKMSIDD